MQNPIGIFGGTFDPIHFGHIRLAEYVLQNTPLVEIRFIPVNIPPHRKLPIANCDKRLEMLRLAFKEHSDFVIDEREIARGDISYTINTLKSLCIDFPETPLCLIMGYDEFAVIETWNNWGKLLNYCNFIVINRPDITTRLSKSAQKLFDEFSTTDKNDLKNFLHGKIFFLKMPKIPISATKIRANLAAKKIPKKDLPEAVLKYISQKEIYSS